MAETSPPATARCRPRSRRACALRNNYTSGRAARDKRRRVIAYYRPITTETAEIKQSIAQVSSRGGAVARDGRFTKIPCRGYVTDFGSAEYSLAS